MHPDETSVSVAGLSGLILDSNIVVTTVRCANLRDRGPSCNGTTNRSLPSRLPSPHISSLCQRAPRRHNEYVVLPYSPELGGATDGLLPGGGPSGPIGCVFPLWQVKQFTVGGPRSFGTFDM